MPTDFKPRGTSSFDQESGVHIPMPRILPHTFQDGREGVEYQFSIRKGGELIDGLGVFGTEDVIEAAGRREWVFSIDLSAESALRSMLRSKERIGSADDDITFLTALARGLVNVFAGQDDNRNNVSYVAFTSVEALSALGLPVPASVRVVTQGTVVLAEVHVRAHRAVTNQRGHAP
jgi:hypothetical protein